MEPITVPLFRVEKAKIDVTKKDGVMPKRLTGRVVSTNVALTLVPDILSIIQNQDRVRLTRDTVYEILWQSGRLADALKNPQMFVDEVVDSIESVLADLMIDGIQYQKIGAREYELRLFAGYEFHSDENTFEVNNPGKTINEGWLPLDSSVEKQFAKDCESSKDIRFYFKLPPWFKIKTPIGNYNPDWALIKNRDQAVYFVAETKSKNQELRPGEEKKIKFGTAHYEELGVEFKQVSEVRELD